MAKILSSFVHRTAKASKNSIEYFIDVPIESFYNGTKQTFFLLLNICKMLSKACRINHLKTLHTFYLFIFTKGKRMKNLHILT